MFGTLRFFLAFLVVAQHLALAYGVGNIAVFGFFILSGYLMTVVTQTVYADALDRYALNRSLRIFPPYLAVLFATIVVLLILPIPIWTPVVRVPETVLEWITNVTTIGLTQDSMGARPLPHAWSLFVELFYYALIPLLARTPRTTLLWFAVSVAYAVLAWDLPFYDRYFSLAAGSLPFSLGAMIFHYGGPTRERRVPVLLGVIVFAVVLASTILVPDDLARSLHLYLGMIVVAYLVFALASRNASGFLNRLDCLLGDLAYPVFLCHWLVGAVVAYAFELPRSVELLTVSLPFVVLASLAIRWLVELPLASVRDRVRHSVASALASGAHPSDGTGRRQHGLAGAQRNMAERLQPGTAARMARTDGA
ncbi:MAG: acyltransferase [Alphaproteobacteria bacterium]|nr:acyltransferase [Alphaproteobacteria bacterium]